MSLRMRFTVFDPKLNGAKDGALDLSARFAEQPQSMKQRERVVAPDLVHDGRRDIFQEQCSTDHFGEIRLRQ